MARRRYGYRRRKNSMSDFEAIIWFFALLIIIPVFLFKFLVQIITWMIQCILAIANFFSSLSSSAPKSNHSNVNYYKNNNYNTSKYSSTKVNQSSNLLEAPMVTKTVEKTKVLKSIVKTPFDELFADQIKFRGINYYKENKIDDYSKKEQNISAVVNGTEKYKTSITFYKNGKIKNAECSCPYFQNDGKYCKHLYALLIKYCEEEEISEFINKEEYEEITRPKIIVNKSNIYNNLLSICDSMKQIISDCEEFYDNCDYQSDIEDIYDEITKYNDILLKYQNTKMNDLSPEIFYKAKSDLESLKDLFDDLKDEVETLIENLDGEERESFFNEAVALGFIANEMHKDSLRQQEEFEEREKMKREWGLLDFEADLVEKGEYEPCQFSEPGEGDELDEDDYYYDDYE